MRSFFLVLILIFGLQSWTKADDIRDFEIEGISIGDSLLDHFSESEVINLGNTIFKSDTASIVGIALLKYLVLDNLN